MCAEQTTLPPSDIERVPPHSIDAERCVLGSMMLDERVLAAVVDAIDANAFYVPGHRAVFKAARKLFEHQTAVDVVTVTNEILSQGRIEQIGGAAYLTELTDAVPTTANYEHYLKIVQDKWILRELIRTSQSVAAQCYVGELEVEQLLEAAQREVFDIAQRRTRGEFKRLKEMMLGTIDHLAELQEKKGNVTGVDTGFTELNDYTTGFHGGELIVIAARPAMGKTALVLNLAENVSLLDNRAVAIFSLEMTARQIVMRLLSSHARVDGQRLRRGDMRKQDWTALVQAGSALGKADIYIDASSQLTPLELRARCRRLKAEEPNLSLVIVDYIQLMDAPGRGIESRQQEISYISRSLKAMALELNLPVVALSQLNRESERGREKGARPQLSQLRESGAIEQDADLVMLLYRPSYYSDDPKYENHAEVIIAKQRNGPVGTIHLQFLDRFARFENPPEGFMDAYYDDE